LARAPSVIAGQDGARRALGHPARGGSCSSRPRLRDSRHDRAILALFEETGEHDHISNARWQWQGTLDRHHYTISDRRLSSPRSTRRGLVVRPSATTEDARRHANALPRKNLIRLASYRPECGASRRTTVSGIGAARGEKSLRASRAAQALDRVLRRPRSSVTGRAQRLRSSAARPKGGLCIDRIAAARLPPALPRRHPAARKIPGRRERGFFFFFGGAGPLSDVARHARCGNHSRTARPVRCRGTPPRQVFVRSARRSERYSL